MGLRTSGTGWNMLRAYGEGCFCVCWDAKHRLRTRSTSGRRGEETSSFQFRASALTVFPGQQQRSFSHDNGNAAIPRVPLKQYLSIWDPSNVMNGSITMTLDPEHEIAGIIIIVIVIIIIVVFRNFTFRTIIAFVLRTFFCTYFMLRKF